MHQQLPEIIFDCELCLFVVLSLKRTLYLAVRFGMAGTVERFIEEKNEEEEILVEKAVPKSILHENKWTLL